MLWDAITAITSTVSMVAFILTAIYIRDQLKGQGQDRYLHITSDLFGVWQSRDFMEMQLWIIHKLQETAWPEFVARHRSDYGEVAFHRVGSFYDRVGTLVRLGLVNDREILATIGGYAIAVWNKLEPLVREARRIENSDLFVNYERILPACRECYVPNLASGEFVSPFELDQSEPAGPDAGKISIGQLKERLDRGDGLTLVDVRHPSQVQEDPRKLPTAHLIPMAELEQRMASLPPGRPAVVYCS
ncbi:MAG: hypothetical protein U0790_12540 [Isosphaeraceae bacterium]